MNKKFIICVLMTMVLTIGMPAPVLCSCAPEAPVENPKEDPDSPDEPDVPDTPDTPDTPDPEPEPEPGDGIIRILAIGNSFSQDAVEQYLYELFDAAGQKVIIGNMYIGGCTLETHYKNSVSGEGKYYYRKVVDGVKTETANVPLLTGVKDEKWDYISLQQASGKSGIYSTYTPYLASLISYLRTNATNKNAVLMWHQTWAYSTTSDHSEYPNYGKDQMTMYNAIMNAAQQAMAEHTELSVVVPSGTAVQNGRTSYIGDAFNRDGYHLEVNHGRYTAACTWYETISGKSVVGNSYAPASVSSAYKEICQEAAHAAVLKPWELTELVDYKTPKVEDALMAYPVQIDFGGASTSPDATWSKVNVYSSASPIYLKNTKEQTSAIQISSLSGFTSSHNGVGSESGKALTIGGVEYPCAVWCDGIVVGGEKGKGDVGPAKIELSGFEAGQKYDFTIIAVRYNGSFAARQTKYTLTGAAASDTKTINQGLKNYTVGDSQEGGYDNYYAQFNGVSPNSDGKFTLEVVGVDTSLAADGQVSAIVISKN